MALVLLFLVPAVITDLKTAKIPNFIIVSGYVTGFCYQAVCHGYAGVWEGILGALFPIVVLFPVFYIRGLGAGDLKLLSVAGCFFTLQKSIDCLIITIFFGAILSVVKMLYQHNFTERIQYLISYVRDVYTTGQFQKYNMETYNAQLKDMESRIHMSVPVLLSALLCIGGFY